MGSLGEMRRENLSKLRGDQRKAEKHTFVGFTDDPVVIKYYDAHLHDIWESQNCTWVEPSPIVDIESISDVWIEGSCQISIRNH